MNQGEENKPVTAGELHEILKRQARSGALAPKEPMSEAVAREFSLSAFISAEVNQQVGGLNVKVAELAVEVAKLKEQNSELKSKADNADKRLSDAEHKAETANRGFWGLYAVLISVVIGGILKFLWDFLGKNG